MLVLLLPPPANYAAATGVTCEVIREVVSHMSRAARDAAWKRADEGQRAMATACLKRGKAK